MTWVPRGRFSGSVITMVWSTARTVASSRALPVASIRPITAGVTASLNRNCTVLGASARTLPSPGSVDTSDACADAPDAKQRTDSNVARPAIRRIVQALRFRHQFDARCRRLAVMPVDAMAFRWNIDPAADPLLAFLHNRKIQHGIRLQSVDQEGADDEFTIVVVGQLAAAPNHLLDAFRQFGAVIVVVGGISALDNIDIPAGLRHRLHRDHAFGDLNAELDRGRTGAAVRHAEHRPVIRADRRLTTFQRDMGARR